MESIGYAVRLAEYRLRLVNAELESRLGLPFRMAGKHRRRLVTSVRIAGAGIALITMVVLSNEAVAQTVNQVTREGWDPVTNHVESTSFADMQFNGWNTELPGDIGDRRASTLDLSYDALRFREENEWLPTGNAGLSMVDKTFRIQPVVVTYSVQYATAIHAVR